VANTRFFSSKEKCPFKIWRKISVRKDKCLVIFDPRPQHLHCRFPSIKYLIGEPRNYLIEELWREEKLKIKLING